MANIEILTAAYKNGEISRYLLADGSNIDIRVTNADEDWRSVLDLRKQVYVDSENRLTSVGDMANTFDKFNDHSTYFIAYMDERAVGCVKVIADSRVGLPCEEEVDLSTYRRQGTLAEIGHLIVLKEIRSKSLGSLLMREALIHCVRNLAVTHLIGDFFVDDTTRGLHTFYVMLGFQLMCKPYRDVRFVGGPESVVAILNITDALSLSKTGTEAQQRLLSIFFHDYDRYSRPTT